jgi:hypothetical protein
MTSTIIAHDEITGKLFTSEGFAAVYGGCGEAGRVEILHDPCCRGEVCLGVAHESQRMQVASLYLSQEAAVTAAVALLAAVAHIQRPAGTDFGSVEEDVSEEAWREGHERATAWVRENVLR